MLRILLELTEKYSDILSRPLFVAYNRGLDYRPAPVRSTLTKYINSTFGMNTHMFRKIRLTHLNIHYGFGPKEIEKFAGHSDLKSSEPYLRIGTRDFESRMVGGSL